MLNMLKRSFKPDPNDFIIVVMGPTGSGKSNFINHLTGQKETPNARSLMSDTKSVTPHVVHRDGFRIVLVDTPGFDNTCRSDSDVLREISIWLTQKSPDGTTLKVSGMLYFHRITDKQMFGTVYKNLQMFDRICGNVPLHRARLVTTMWGIGDQLAAQRREKELKDDFWKDLISAGAGVKRFHNTPESAQVIVNDLLTLGNHGDDLLLQEEIVEQGKHLKETEAGKIVNSRFQRLLVEQRKTLKGLIDEAKIQNDSALAKSLQEEHEEIDAQFQKTFEEIDEMEVPLPRRISLWLFGRKPLGRAIEFDQQQEVS